MKIKELLSQLNSYDPTLDIYYAQLYNDLRNRLILPDGKEILIEDKPDDFKSLIPEDCDKCLSCDHRLCSQCYDYEYYEQEIPNKNGMNWK